MLTILIIDDDAPAAEQAKKSIQKLDGEVQCYIGGFENAKKLIIQYRPDIVVLDLLGPITEVETPGMGIREFIWKDHFCPYIVWSAEPSRHDDEYPLHPFAKSVKKGSGAEQKLNQEIQGMMPYIETLKEIDDYNKRQFSLAMQEVSPKILTTITAEEKQVDIITRVGRRRIAARIDELQSDDDALAPWEMYVCPPVSDNLRLGDIVKKADGNSNDPNVFFVILSPSCDLIDTEGRAPKVSEVLVAQCIPTRDGLDRANLGGLSSKKSNRLKGQFLSPGHLNGIIPLPKYFEKIPSMSADVRKLRLIPMQDLRNKQEYDRVASIDSPFRELISWAYMQTSCRPGLPERDYDAWIKEIAGDLDSARNT